MARVTVEDCVVRVPNRFELVMLTSRRARAISAGEPLLVERDKDKNPVVSLREIGDGKIDLDELRSSLIRGLQKHVEVDLPEEDNMATLMAGQEWSEANAADNKAELKGVKTITEDAGKQAGAVDEAAKNVPSKDGPGE